jgi:predicted small lipoprotein YifL
MKLLKSAVLILLFLFSLAGCLEKSDTFFPELTLTQGSIEKQSVTSQGATILFKKSGITLEIEKGDLTQSSEITALSYAPDKYPGTKMANTYSLFSNYHKFDNIFIENNKNVKVTIPYNNGPVSVSAAAASALDYSKLNIHAYDSDMGKWNKITNGKQIDTVKMTISVLAGDITCLIVALEGDIPDSGTVTAQSAM